MRTLLLVNANLGVVQERAGFAAQQPRKDYLELQRALSADILDLEAVQQYGWTRFLGRCMGGAVAQALLAWTRAAHYDVVFADRETTGFILAALHRLRRRNPRLLLIGHMLSPFKKRLLFRILRLHRTVSRVIVHSTRQRQVAEDTLGLAQEQVALVPYQTDTKFWKPQLVPLRRMICSAGLEYRDYATLIEAVAGMDIEVVIAAASHWSNHAGLGEADRLPDNVQVTRLNYAELRRLYAQSLFVVVPLQDVENQAGITTILEAMAMGKAVIVSQTLGQTDVVRDRRRLSRSDPQRPTQPTWASVLGAAEETARGHTGIYVRPGDADELRRAIQFLIDHPETARAMGANGRRLIEETMCVDHFTERIAAIVRDERPQRAEPVRRQLVATS